MIWQILIRPLQLPGIVLILAFTLLGRVLVFFLDLIGEGIFAKIVVGGLGTLVWYAILGFLVSYGLKQMTHLSAGLFTERIDQETDLNPFQNTLAFKGTMTLLIPLACWIAFGRDATILELFIPAALFPFIYLSIALEESFFAGLHPNRIMKVLAGLGIWYLAVMLFLSVTAGYMLYVIIWQHNILLFFLSAYAFVVGNMFTGLVLFARRNQLILHTEKSPEQEHAQAIIAEAESMDRLFEVLHRLCDSGSLAKAYKQLDEYIADAIDDIDPQVHRRLLDFHDKRLTLEHSVHYLERLALRGEPKKAWAILLESLAIDEMFRPLSDQTLLDLTHAAEKDDAREVSQVLANFAATYPDSKLIPDALFRRARVVLELLRDTTRGTQLLREIASQHPEFAATPQYQDYAKQLNPG